MGIKNIRIAVVTDDGKTISSHFGRARFYEVATVENGAVVKKERREKTGHHTFSRGEDHSHPEGHGLDDLSQKKHTSMISNILDCQLLLARGMGMGAFQSLTGSHIEPVLTDILNIDEAVQSVLNGTIINRKERLH